MTATKLPDTAAAAEQAAPTVGALLASVARELAASPTPRLDAEVLLAFCTGATRATLLAFPERPVSEAQRAAFAHAVQRRACGAPIAYITGEKEFYSLPLRVSPDVLVPRADTELLVDTALYHIDEGVRSSVLDLGTGSGAIALAIKQQRPSTEVVASDCDPAALEVARDNARRLGLAVRFVVSHWLDAFARERFDVIVANPPYVRSEDPHFAGPLGLEPRLALDGGADGLEAYRAILAAAREHLTPRGLLLLEHGYDQRASVLELAAAAGLAPVAVHEDAAGLPRLVVLKAAAP